MALVLKSHVCGTVHVVECKGRIVAGPEGEALLATLRQDWYCDLNHVVLQIGEVSRLDSMGLGIIVRSAVHLRQSGGDLRLSDAPARILEILSLTRIDSVINIFPTEQDAVLSFLKNPRPAPCAACDAGRILLVEQSPDFCAFATALLTQHGYKMILASLVSDARILLIIEKPDFILIGPGMPRESVGAAAATFRSLAPEATVLPIDPSLKTSEPQESGEILLHMLSTHAVHSSVSGITSAADRG